MGAAGGVAGEFSQAGMESFGYMDEDETGTLVAGIVFILGLLG